MDIRCLFSFLIIGSLLQAMNPQVGSLTKRARIVEREECIVKLQADDQEEQRRKVLSEYGGTIRSLVSTMAHRTLDDVLIDNHPYICASDGNGHVHVINTRESKIEIKKIVSYGSSSADNCRASLLRADNVLLVWLECYGLFILRNAQQEITKGKHIDLGKDPECLCTNNIGEFHFSQDGTTIVSHNSKTRTIEIFDLPLHNANERKEILSVYQFSDTAVEQCVLSSNGKRLFLIKKN